MGAVEVRGESVISSKEQRYCGVGEGASYRPRESDERKREERGGGRDGVAEARETDRFERGGAREGLKGRGPCWVVGRGAGTEEEGGRDVRTWREGGRGKD